MPTTNPPEPLAAWHVATAEDTELAVRHVAGLARRLDPADPDTIGDGTAVYDHRKARAEGFMVAGNGPTVWAWFVFNAEGDIDHAYVECSGAHAPALATIPAHFHERLLAALREDTTHGVYR